QSRFAVGAGSLLKQQLLYGALHLEPEEIRSQGAGQMLGRVIEANAVETLSLSGGFLGVVALIELIAAAVVLRLGVTGWLHVCLLMAWVALAVALGWLHFRRRRTWTQTRLALTNDLIERMVGHRTRLAQERVEGWHTGEDRAVEGYLAHATATDRAALM